MHIARLVIASLIMFSIYMVILVGLIIWNKKKIKQQDQVTPRHRHPDNVRRQWGEITDSQEIIAYSRYMSEG